MGRGQFVLTPHHSFFLTDSEGNADSRKTTQDESCLCTCSRCLCVLFEIPTALGSVGNSGCGIVTYDNIISKCTKRDAAAIQAVGEAQRTFNNGLYQRALILKKSADEGFSFVVPLKLLSPFFALDTIFPGKRIISLEFKLNSDPKNLILEADVSDRYSLVVTDINLSLAYVTYEPQLRISWYQILQNQKLIRDYECERTSHFTLLNTSKLHYLTNVLPYGIFPRALLICFITENQHAGCFDNRFVYKHFKLKSLQVFKNGVPHADNPRMTDMSLNDDLGLDSFFWYSNFLNVMGKKAKSVSYNKFHKDFFIFCIDLCGVPPHLMLDSSGEFRTLNLVTSGSIDLTIELTELVPTNLICKVIGLHHGICKFDESGEILEDDS